MVDHKHQKWLLPIVHFKTIGQCWGSSHIVIFTLLIALNSEKNGFVLLGALDVQVYRFSV